MGMGSGMASTKSKKKKKGGGGGGGNNKSKEKRTPFDAAASMIKSEKLYDELMAESTKALLNSDDDAYYDDDSMDVTTEYIITARAKKTNGSNNSNSERQQSSPVSSSFVGANDWVPVAQMCLIRSITQDDNTNNSNNNDHEAIMESTLQAAISYYCREINYAACLSAPSAFQSLPRNNVEYGVEPIDSFMRYVYEDVIEGKKGGNGAAVESAANGNATGSSSSSSNGSNGMTKAQAREILELEVGVTDTTLIKTAYKKQSFKYHPDRVSEEDRATSSDKFGLIKRAYDTLNSGIRNSDKQSWYESLGGRERNEFMGPITLLSMDKASALCNKAFRSAVVGIDPDLTMAFVARNQAAARL